MNNRDVGSIQGPYTAGLPRPDYESGVQTVTFNSRLELAHGFGQVPTMFTVTLRCKTAQANYTAGDEVQVGYEGSSSGNAGAISFANATNVVVVTGNGLDILDHDTPFDNVAVTAASWEYVVRAWR